MAILIGNNVKVIIGISNLELRAYLTGQDVAATDQSWQLG